MALTDLPKIINDYVVGNGITTPLYFGREKTGAELPYIIWTFQQQVLDTDFNNTKYTDQNHQTFNINFFVI